MSTIDPRNARSYFRNVSIPVNGTIVLFAGLLVLWQVVSLSYSASQFPGFIELIDAMGEIYNSEAQYKFWEHVPITIFRIFLAVAISMLIGVPIGIAMGANSDSLGFFRFYLLVLLTVPSVMWAFLGVTWFGLTEYLVPLFATVLALLPYVMINIWKGTEAVDKKLIEMGTVFDFSSLAVWRQIYIPHLMPYLFSTTRMVFSLSWRIVITVELFGTQAGLGFVINGYYLSQQNDMLLAWSIPVFLLMFGLERLIQRIETQKLGWRDSDQTQVAGA